MVLRGQTKGRAAQGGPPHASGWAIPLPPHLCTVEVLHLVSLAAEKRETETGPAVLSAYTVSNVTTLRSRRWWHRGAAQYAYLTSDPDKDAAIPRPKGPCMLVSFCGLRT